MAKKKWSFGDINADRQKEISALGGAAAHAQGVAHEWTSKEAQTASLKRMKGRPHRRLKARKRSGRYEYYVPDVVASGKGGWVTRQRVHQLRVEGKL